MSRGVQPIQSADGGIITDIFVQENEEVAAGQVLARISNIRAIAEYHDLINKEVEYTLALVRLEAERQGVIPAFTEDNQKDHPFVVRDQMRLYNSRTDQYQSEGRELEALLDQKELEVEEAQRRREQFEKSLLLLKQQEKQIRPLVGRSYSEIDYLNLRQRIVSQEGELNGLAQVISRAQSAVREAEEKLRTREPERHAKIADEMNKVRQELSTTKESLEARSDRVSRTDLRAPMNGVVKSILLKQDSVARSAETIMELLPLEDTLEVVARFHPKDRGFIDVGQEATIKISAYDFSIYGGMQAYITSISADTIEDSKGQPWYEVRLRTTTSTLPGKEDLEMKVGMTVLADVLSGEKSIFTYLMKPLFRSKIKQHVIGRDLSEVPQEIAPEDKPALEGEPKSSDTI